MAHPKADAAQLLSIGEVLAVLREEFPDVSISKLRFLESGGLVSPERTASGYRKFSLIDIERLRYILRMQRDHFLPLRVIRDHIDAMDRGLQPPAVGQTKPVAPRPLESTDALARMAVPTRMRLTMAELAAQTGTDVAFIASLLEFGLLRTDQDGYFDGLALATAEVCSTLRSFGLEARHLKTVLQGAARDVDLFSPIVRSARSGKQAASVAQAEELTLQIATALVSLHGLLVRALTEATD
jgi:DNA-binding transcriptional MerR regulator